MFEPSIEMGRAHEWQSRLTVEIAMQRQDSRPNSLRLRELAPYSALASNGVVPRPGHVQRAEDEFSRLSSRHGGLWSAIEPHPHCLEYILVFPMRESSVGWCSYTLPALGSDEDRRTDKPVLRSLPAAHGFSHSLGQADSERVEGVR